MTTATVCGPMWPKETPRLAMTRENSEIWARLRVATKAARLPPPVRAISGKMVAKREKMVKPTTRATGPIMEAVGTMIFIPSDTKNSVMKKSRSGSVLAVTWIEYGNAAIDSPATSAPISFDSPIALAPAATTAHHPIDTASTISGFVAIDVNTRRSTYFDTSSTPTTSPALPSTALTIGPTDGLAKFG